jgi:hypothetical protein
MPYCDVILATIVAIPNSDWIDAFDFFANVRDHTRWDPFIRLEQISYDPSASEQSLKESAAEAAHSVELIDSVSLDSETQPVDRRGGSHDLARIDGPSRPGERRWIPIPLRSCG